MSVGLENGKSDNENEIKIKESPSIIISQTLEKSFSDSSIQSYKKYTDLLSLKEENKSSEKIINSLYFNKLKTNSKMLFNHNLNFKGVIQNACPGAGACGGMYTANTMSSAIEALGMSLPYSWLKTRCIIEKASYM